MSITKENKTALFIDFQERLFPAMNEKETLLKNTKMLVEGLTLLGIPTVFTQQYTKGLGETIEEIKSLVPGFAAIEKTDFSCFGAKEYTDFLQHHQCRTCLLYTSDAADEEDSVDLGGRRIIKKKNITNDIHRT